jgi:4'-phosphopantetheinyl transferase
MKPFHREDLAGHAVVWIAEVSRSMDSLSFLEPYLDAYDRERAVRFHFTEDRARFVIGRALLRKSLGHYVKQSPETIELAYTNRGRPVFPHDETVQFSLSHTHDLVALALTSHAQVGIDLEYLKPHLDLPDLARQILCDADFQIFLGLPAHEMPLAFLRAWTRKEAYLKARGEGIADGVQQVSVSFVPEEIGFPNDTREEFSTQRWRLLDLPVPAGYWGSLACDDPEKRLELNFVHFDKGEVVLTLDHNDKP